MNRGTTPSWKNYQGGETPSSNTIGSLSTVVQDEFDGIVTSFFPEYNIFLQSLQGQIRNTSNFFLPYYDFFRAARFLKRVPCPLLSPSTISNGNLIVMQTSLVARPPISFDLCKERLDRRLKHHGIDVAKVLDEEFCYIPMGGAMPKLNQARGPRRRR